MKFLADENISNATIKILKENGYDVFILDEKSRGSTDIRLLDIASEKQLILLTHDKDFGELIFRDFRNKPAGVVLFRLKDDLPDSAGKILISILEKAGLDLESHFTVIEDIKIRQRKY